MSNVVDINHRGAPAIAAEPDKNVIEQVEWLLEAARSGEVQGIVGAIMFRDGTAAGFSAGYRGNALIGALERRKHVLINALLGD